MREGLRPEVSQYAHEAFRLGVDLDRLEVVARAGAPEAVVLYGARITEALAGAALERLGTGHSSNLYAMLCSLEGLGLVGGTDRYVAHGLRRLGNGIRHVWYVASPEDVEAVVALLEAWLEWFFCRFPLGARLPGLTEDGTPSIEADATLAARGLRTAVRIAVPGADVAAVAEAGASTWRALADRGGSGDVSILAAAIEALIGRGRHEQATELLALGRERAPRDPRLAQLQGLLLSRELRLDEAIGLLEDLRRRSPADGETLGILAGAYQRAEEQGRGRSYLERAHATYAKAWRASRGQNDYVGINAAATALFLGRTDACREIAGEVRALLEDRMTRSTHTQGMPAVLPYYPLVTLAEAHLLEGHRARAVDLYRRAFEVHRARSDDVRGTRLQADRILREIGAAETLSDLLAEGGGPIWRAAALARAAHEGQVDKVGADYFDGHVTRVALDVWNDRSVSEQAVATAFLHDVVEDTDVELDDLRGLFGEDVAAAVDVLTRREGESYEASIQRCVDAGGLALRVKRADVRDHLRDTQGISEQLVRRYRRAATALGIDA